MKKQRITLVGFGLLASSIAAALKQSKKDVIVRAVSSKDTLERAKALDLADEFYEYSDLLHWVSGSDLIFLCTPISRIFTLLQELLMVKPIEKIIVCDIGSTKEEICKLGFILKDPFLFVGTHPMSGSEKSSLEYNDPSIFENAYWFLCPPPGVDPKDYQILKDCICFLGSHPISITPKEHDFIMAWLSHMPQILSSTLAASLPTDLLEKEQQHYAGRGFKDMTRIAGSSWNIWKDIYATNSEYTSLALKSLIQELHQVDSSLDSLKETIKPLEKLFLRGNEGRASLFAPGRNVSGRFFELTVPLKDEPGALLSVLSPLAEHKINVRDIELMKVRENIAGTLLLAFKNESEAIQAEAILKNLAYKVKKR